MRFIKLNVKFYKTDSKEFYKDVYLNVDKIVSFYLIAENETNIHLNDHCIFECSESPEEILELIGGKINE
jgi:hypothetical protein